VLRETTSRGLCGLGCPSRTSERGGEGDCVKEGGGEEGKSRSWGCERDPFCCTWLLDPNLSWVMLRSKTKLRLPV
jgi:hypothetical protein